MNIYYLGLTDGILKNTNFFKEAILVKSKEKTIIPTCEEVLQKTVDYNDLENFETICNYYDCMIQKVLSKDKDAKFLPYNQICRKHIKNIDKLVCINDLQLLIDLNNKFEARKILVDVVKTLEYKYLQGREINYEKIQELFDDSNIDARYVIQEFIGFAGIGTFLISKNNEKNVIKRLRKDAYYSVSKYVEDNISVNNTFMISGEEILIFDGSFQNILEKDELLYDGWDFEKYNKLDQTLRKKIYKQTFSIAKKLKSLGYVGIAGVDYIIENNEIYFMEINPRFQSSSIYLNSVMQARGFPSIFELQYLSFYDNNKFKYWKSKWEEFDKGLKSLQ